MIRFHHPDQQGCLAKEAAGEANRMLFDRVVTRSFAWQVHEIAGQAVQYDSRCDRIPGGSGEVRGDRHFPSGQPIEQ